MQPTLADLMQESECLGFIAVRKHVEHGYFGGLLLVNSLGRPLEFHCTLPVKPSRAQSILYGPTLEDFICGEQIGNALLSRTKSKPKFVLVDSNPLLALRHLSKQPVILVLDRPDRKESVERPQRGGLDFPDSQSISFETFDCDGVSLAVAEGHAQVAGEFQAWWGAVRPQLDPTEPFGRIVEAIAEAHPSAKAA